LIINLNLTRAIGRVYLAGGTCANNCGGETFRTRQPFRISI